MRDSRVAPTLLCAALSLSIAACAAPQATVRQVAAPPGPGALAQVPDVLGEAEKLHRLNVMLMVTALRCRRSADDFTADYQRFAGQQALPLAQAGAQLRGDYIARQGARAGQVAFERLGTSMANGYGQGHAWLSCGQLRQVTRNLSAVQGRATLVEAADQLLAPRAPSRVALVKR